MRTCEKFAEKNVQIAGTAYRTFTVDFAVPSGATGGVVSRQSWPVMIQWPARTSTDSSDSRARILLTTSIRTCWIGESAKIARAKATKNFNSAGYSMGGPAADLSRTSDYMITHFRAFKRATGDVYWDLAINKSFEVLSLMQSKFAANTGLIPDFIVELPNNPAPSPGGRIESMTEGFFAWNACRIPWRLG